MWSFNLYLVNERIWSPSNYLIDYLTNTYESLKFQLHLIWNYLIHPFVTDESTSDNNDNANISSDNYITKIFALWDSIEDPVGKDNRLMTSHGSFGYSDFASEVWKKRLSVKMIRVPVVRSKMRFKCFGDFEKYYVSKSRKWKRINSRWKKEIYKEKKKKWNGRKVKIIVPKNPKGIFLPYDEQSNWLGMMREVIGSDQVDFLKDLIESTEKAPELSIKDRVALRATMINYDRLINDEDLYDFFTTNYKNAKYPLPFYGNDLIEEYKERKKKTNLKHLVGKVNKNIKKKNIEQGKGLKKNIKKNKEFVKKVRLFQTEDLIDSDRYKKLWSIVELIKLKDFEHIENHFNFTPKINLIPKHLKWVLINSYLIASRCKGSRPEVIHRYVVYIWKKICLTLIYNHVYYFQWCELFRKWGGRVPEHREELLRYIQENRSIHLHQVDSTFIDFKFDLDNMHNTFHSLWNINYPYEVALRKALPEWQRFFSLLDPADCRKVALQICNAQSGPHTKDNMTYNLRMYNYCNTLSAFKHWQYCSLDHKTIRLRINTYYEKREEWQEMKYMIFSNHKRETETETETETEILRGIDSSFLGIDSSFLLTDKFKDDYRNITLSNYLLSASSDDDSSNSSRIRIEYDDEVEN